MTRYKRILEVYRDARELTVDGRTRMVFLSDLHRGTGGGADNFAKNQNLYLSALSYYDRGGFTYMELGDGDELWENRRFPAIAAEYGQVFSLLSRLYREGRFHMLWGNHDAVKRREKWVRRNLDTYRDHREPCARPLLPGARVEEGIVLRWARTNRRILLLHGHQADFFNDRLWRLSKTLVRYLWKPLELVGVTDPMNASANPRHRLKVEKTLAAWSDRERVLLVAGHTHRPIFPKPGESLYFNDGSGVHPRYVTALELERGALTLVKWEVGVRPDRLLQVERAILDGPVPVEDFFAAQEGRTAPAALCPPKAGVH